MQRSMMVWSIFLGFLLLYETKYAEGQASDLSNVTTITTNLGLQILQSGNASRNQIFSPIATAINMAMFYTGAKGETKSQIEKYVFNGLTEQAVKEYSKSLIDTASNKRNPSEFYNVSYANGIFLGNRHPVLEVYKATLLKYYDGYVKNVDFETNPESARQEINNWVEEATNHEIKDMYPQHALDNADMVLVYALYFKDTWKYKFNEADTMKKDFFTSENENSIVDMMSQSNMQLYYFEDDMVQVLGLPFGAEKDRELLMYIILPINRFGLDEVISTMTMDRFQELIVQGQERKINTVELPKFKLESNWNGSNFFRRLGLTDMFDPELADFSGIDGSKGLYVSDFMHRLVLEVNEEGAQAVRADAGTGKRRTLDIIPIKFTANQPFLFAFVEKTAWNVWFMGRIVKIQ